MPQPPRPTPLHANSVSFAPTAYADPASFPTFDPNLSTDLLHLIGALPSTELVTTPATVPEPASVGMLALGILSAVGFHAARQRTGHRSG